jgi:hypothetical protein
MSDMSEGGPSRRLDLADDWHAHGGILVLSYQMFVGLTDGKFARPAAKGKHTGRTMDELLATVGPDLVRGSSSLGSSMSFLFVYFFAQSFVLYNVFFGGLFSKSMKFMSTARHRSVFAQGN